MKFEFFRYALEKKLNVKFDENPSSGSRVVPSENPEGRTDGRIDMTKPLTAFRDLANAPKNGCV
jgi:hypothetical protein